MKDKIFTTWKSLMNMRQTLSTVPAEYIRADGIYRKGITCGELFQVWEMWLSPHLEKPVGREVGGQDPRPWIGSPVGNQACIVPRLL